MSTKLKEGYVIKSQKFVWGIKQPEGHVNVGDYDKNSIRWESGEIDIQPLRAENKYVVISVKEYFPEIAIGNRESSYENRFIAKQLNPDGTYNEDGEEIRFSTCNMYIEVALMKMT
jgi:hypothetical protein